MNRLPPDASSWTRALVALSLFALVGLACQPLADRTYSGPSLGSISGAITTQTAVDGTFRLALVWQTVSDVSDDTVQTQDTDYSGADLHYALELHALPPDSAFQDVPTGGRYAGGALVAYQDRNGNHQLDRIPRGGHPIDEVIGAAVPSTSQTLYLVLFADRPLVLTQEGLAAPLALDQGLNILELWSGEFVPTEISNPSGHPAPASGQALTVVGAPLMARVRGRVDHMDIALAPSAWNNSALCAWLDGLGCLVESPTGLVVQAQAYLDSAAGGSALVQVGAYDGMPETASVQLNGVSLSFADPASGVRAYTLKDPASSVLHTGINTLDVSLEGHDSVHQTFSMDPVHLLSPTAEASVSLTSSRVSWDGTEEGAVFLVTFVPDSTDGGFTGSDAYFTQETHSLFPSSLQLGGATVAVHDLPPAVRTKNLLLNRGSSSSAHVLITP